MSAIPTQAVRTDIEGETLILLAERAVYWPRRRTLIVADVHLGKAATFRKAAIPVPGNLTGTDLTRLSQLLTQTEATRLVLLGDFIHAKAGRTEAVLGTVAAWREAHAETEMILVRGNHDRHAGDPPAEWRIDTDNEPLFDSPFAFRHYPEVSSQGYTLAGHLHPAVQLNGRGRQRTKLACFHFGVKVGILPAFGSFTGSALIRPLPSDRVYVVAEDQVVLVK